MNFKDLRQSISGRGKLLSKTTILAMKLTAILLITGLLQVSARGYSQKITLKEVNASQAKVIQDLRGFGYQFLLPDDFVIHKTYNINVSNVPIEEVLDILLKDQPWTYKVLENVVAIKQKEVPHPIENSKPQETVTAAGTVFNQSGQPLSEANVALAGTGKIITTDVKGRFSMPGVTVNSSLTISYVGYTTQTIKIKDATPIQVFLVPAKNELDKIVVQAYGNTTHRLSTSNISTVSAAEIERQPVDNVMTALEGKVPGLVITQTSGYASAPFKVEIRGRSVIDPTRPSEPLYVIDGVPLTVLESNMGGNYASGSTGVVQNGLTGPAGGQSPLYSINPNDIESVSVLKDADATAIYGSRGANGVIIITTKTGTIGKTTLDLNAYQGVSEVTRHYSMLNTQQYLMMRHEALNNDGITPDPGNDYDLLTWDTTRYTDWQKFEWGKRGITTNVEGALSGGDKQTSFRLSGAFFRGTDITTASGANQKLSVQSNLTHKSLDQRLNLSFTTTYSYSNLNLTSLPGVVTFSPNTPAAYLPDGALNWSGWYPSANPFGVLLQPYDSKTNFLNSRLALHYEIIKGLVISSNFGYSSTHNQQTFFFPIKSQDPAYNPQGSAQFGINDNGNTIIEPNLEYKTSISKGILNVLVGGSIQSVIQTGDLITGSGYINDNLIRSISNAPTRYATDNNDQYKYAAIFSRINYNWDNKYIINLSARRDGSSRFGSGHQFGNFGAIGAAWLFSEESWLKKNIQFLSFGKLRGSYGLTGSDNISDYQYLSQWSNYQTAYLQGSPAYIPLGFSNPNLEWQVNKKLEAALDLGFLKDRISFEAAWYENRCGNQLVVSPLPVLTGFGSVTENLPATIQNTGIESTLGIKAIDSKDIGVSFNFDIGANRNKLIAFPNLAQSVYASRYIVGQSLNIVRLLHYTGVDPTTGQYTFLDKNHDGIIDRNPNDTANDLYPKDLSVNFDGGFGTDVTYKGLQISIFFRFRNQISPTILHGLSQPGSIQNYPSEILNRWQKPGDKAAFARYTTQEQDSDADFYGYSDGTYGSGSYIRLQNVSLTYQMPKTWSKKAGVNSCKIYFRAENLLLITKYHGIDPDTPFFGALPPSKIFTGGVQLNF